MIDDLYTDALLDAAASLPPRALIDDADATARMHSKVCGSEVTVSLDLEDGVVSNIGLDVKACALGQASSSMLEKVIRGATAAELRELQAQMWAMLREEGPTPTGERFASLATLEAIRAYPARHKSTMLVFDAVVACLDQIDAAEPQ